MKYLLTVEIEVADAPHPHRNTPAELVHGIEHYIEEAWSETDDIIHTNAVSVVRTTFANASLGTPEEQEAWRVAARRRDEARRYYVAWQVARMRAADWKRKALARKE